MTHLLIHTQIGPDDVHRLEGIPGVRVTTLEPLPLLAPPQELAPELLRDVDILVCTLPPANHTEMCRLKFVQISSVGYAQLYGLDLSARGVRACNARGVYDTAIAEWNLGMMINLARDVPRMLRNQNQSRWEVETRFVQEIRGSVVGLWGYGGIGRETARLAKTFGLEVHALTRSGAGPRGDATYTVLGTGDLDGTLPDRVFTAGQELEFLAGLDFLILTMPLTPANKGLVGERELRAMRSTAYLLNPSRGPLVQEAALLRALSENWIAGAALDTHFAYPLPPDHPLWQMPQVILTPHISGSDRGPHYAERFGELLRHNVAQFLANQPLWNELSPRELRGE